MRAPSGEVSVDPTGRAAGRGAYLCADGACWSKALRTRALERALELGPSEALATILAGGPPPLTTGGFHGA